ncbi:glycosyltransferase family 2 protein [Thermodesulfobacteriota bacterium]
MQSGLTIFVPVYNEEAILERNVLELLQYMDRLALPYEIILGSNGSSDQTTKIGYELDQAYVQVRFFHHPLRGPGLAFAEALRRAAHSSFLCLDADLSIDLNFIDRCVEALHDYDAVIGSKQAGTQRRPILRIMASELFIMTTNLLLSMPYRDYSIGAKAYQTMAIRPFLDRIDRHTFYTQELLYRLQKEGKSIIEIAVNCHDRRKSKFNLFHEGFYRFYKLFELWFRSMRH